MRICDINLIFWWMWYYILASYPGPLEEGGGEGHGYEAIVHDILDGCGLYIMARVCLKELIIILAL